MIKRWKQFVNEGRNIDNDDVLNSLLDEFVTPYLSTIKPYINEYNSSGPPYYLVVYESESGKIPLLDFNKFNKKLAIYFPGYVSENRVDVGPDSGPYESLAILIYDSIWMKEMVIKGLYKIDPEINVENEFEEDADMKKASELMAHISKIRLPSISRKTAKAMDGSIISIITGSVLNSKFEVWITNEKKSKSGYHINTAWGDPRSYSNLLEASADIIEYQIEN